MVLYETAFTLPAGPSASQRLRPGRNFRTPAPAIVDRVNTVDRTFYSAADEPLLEAWCLTAGTVPAEIDGSSLQGLTVYTSGERGQWREVETAFLWTGGNWGLDNGWSLAED